MTIYHIPHYILTADNKESVALTFSNSEHDDIIVPYSEAPNQYKPPTTHHNSWGELKYFFAMHVKEAKTKPEINAMFACSFIEGAENKSHENAIDRHWITIDFDEPGCDINFIFDKLKQYVFIAHTSYNSMVPAKANTPRLKIWLPLETPVPLSDWGDELTARNGWMREGISEPIVNMGFVGNNKHDTTAQTFAHYQAAPALNPNTTYVDAAGKPQLDMWINDGVGTSFIDAYVLCPKPAATALTAPTAGVTTGQATTPATPLIAGAAGAVGGSHRDELVRKECIDPVWRKKLADILISKPELTGLSYESLKGGYSYKIMTIGLVLMEYQFNEYKPIYDYMVSGRATSASKDAITNYNSAVAEVKANPKKFNWGLVLKSLTYADKDSLDIVGRDVSPKVYRSELAADIALWDTGYGTAAKPYIDVDSVLSTGQKIVYIVAPPGSGKTYGFSQYDSYSHPVRIIVPSTGIRKQADSENNIFSDTVVTYEQGAKATAHLAKKSILVIDESHQLGLIAFRANALLAFNKIFALPWKRIVFCSATHSANQWDNIVTDLGYDPSIDVYRYKFEPYYKQQVEYFPMSAEGATINAVGKVVKKGVKVLDAIAARCVNAYNNGDKFLVILDDSEDLRKIRSILDMKEINSRVILSDDAGLAGTETYALVNNTDYTMSTRGIDGLLSTRYSCEGINIRDTGNSATVIIGGDLPYEFVYQASGRFRNITNIKVEHISPGNTRHEYNNVVAATCSQRMTDRTDFINSLGTSAQYISKAGLINLMGIEFGDGKNTFKNLSRDGWVFDDSTIGVDSLTPHRLGKSIAYSEIENNKFYKQIENRRIRMEYYGCSIGADIFVTHADIDSLVGAAELKMGGIASRAQKSAGQLAVLEVLKELFDDENPKDIKSIEAIKPFAKSYTKDVWKVIEATKDNPDIEVTTIMDLITKVVMGYIDIDSIDFFVELSKSTIVDNVRKTYKVGDFVTTAQQNQILSDLYNHALAKLVISGKTDIEANKILCSKDKMFEKIDVSDVGGAWVCKSSQPAETLRANGILLLGKSNKKTITIAGIKSRPRGAYVTAT